MTANNQMNHVSDLPILARGEAANGNEGRIIEADLDAVDALGVVGHGQSEEVGAASRQSPIPARGESGIDGMGRLNTLEPRLDPAGGLGADPAEEPGPKLIREFLREWTRLVGR